MSQSAEKRVRFGKYAGLGTMLAAVFFIFNPDIAVVDILPDVFGYILLAISLRHLRDISPHFENAWLKFRTLCLISALKLASLFWVFGGLQSAQERPTMMLLLSFCFCIVELVWGIPAWRSLFEGFILHAQTSGGEYPLRERGRRKNRVGINVSTSMRDLTVFFLVAKAFIANISEFSVLSSHTYDDTAFNWFYYIGLFRVVAAAVGIVLGIVWLCRIVKFFIGMMRDREFIESAKSKYIADVLPKKGLFIKRDIAFVLMILCAALLTSADIYIDLVNYIPDVLTAILLAVFFIRIKPYYRNYHIGIAVSALYGVATVIGSTLSYEFITGSWVEKTWEKRSVFNEFIRMYPVRVIEAALFFITVFIALKGVRAMISAHCGYVPETMDESYRKSRIEGIHKEIYQKVNYCLAMTVVVALIGGLYELILSFGGIVSEVWWMLNLAVSVGFFATSVYMAAAVNEEVESRYMLD